MDLVNQRVRKRFGKRWYLGTVQEVWRHDGKSASSRELLAHIAYDDGDAEDLPVEDARALLLDAEGQAQAQAQAQETLPSQHHAPKLLTDAYQRLPSKRGAGPVDPPRAKRVKAQPGAPKAAVQKLSPDDLAAAKAAKAAAAAAKAEADSEARLVAKERGYTAVTTGSVHVATIRVLFDARPSARHFSGSADELLSKLGKAPALHTLLRVVTADIMRSLTAQQQAEQAHELELKLIHKASTVYYFQEKAQELKDFLVKHSPRFKAAFEASACAAAASVSGSEGSGQRSYTAADFSPGTIVTLARVIPTGDPALYRKLRQAYCTDRLRDNFGVVVSVDQDGAHTVVKVRAPVTLDGKADLTDPLKTLRYVSSYKPEQLLLEMEERKHFLGEVLLGWDVRDVSQFTDMCEKIGIERKPAFARLYEDMVSRNGKDERSDDPSLYQTLAHELYNESWRISGDGRPRHPTGVVVNNLCIASDQHLLQAELQIWLSPDDITSHDDLMARNRFLMRRNVYHHFPSFGNWLMRFGGHLANPLAALDAAERTSPPRSAAEILALAEQNGFQGSVASPAALKVTLKPYQRSSLAWMLAEETGEGMLRHIWHPVTLPVATAEGTKQRQLFYSPLLSAFRTAPPERLCGGWLAEAMGLGKTIVTLGLILSDHCAPNASPSQSDAAVKARIAAADAAYDRRVAAAKLVKTNATLIVAPVSLVAQWESEIKLKCGTLPSGKSLRVARWYGNTRVRDPARLAAEFDVVLTTYETMAFSHNFKEGSVEYEKHVTIAKSFHEAQVIKAQILGVEPPKEKAIQAAQRATLEEIAWRRIVCDESQAMKDASVARSSACAALTSQRRWLLSGTPISTQATDLYGQLKVLQLDVLQSPKPVFTALFETPFRADVAKLCPLTNSHVYPYCGAMKLLMPLLMMRHTKDMTVGGERVLTLPPKTETTVNITLSPTERAAYNAVELEMRSRWRELCSMGIAEIGKHMLLAMSMLQPMQRMCSGGAISPSRDLVKKTGAKTAWTKQMRAPPLLSAASAALLENDPAGQSCAACSLEPEDGVRTKCCGVWACHECLSAAAELEAPKCPGCAATLRRADVPRSAKVSGEGFWGDSMPASAVAPAAVPDAAAAADVITMESKFKALLAELTAVRAADASAKTLIFSQYAHSLAWLGKSLAAHGYQCATITGSMSLSQRVKALDAFQNAPPTTIFLLSLRSGAVGLNLTAASHVILLEPCLNPALEEQAIGRVYRLGQTRPTQVKRLVAANTIEARMRTVVEARVAGGAGQAIAAASLHSMLLANSKAVVALNGTVPSVAGGMMSDRAVLRYDELNTLFGQ